MQICYKTHTTLLQCNEMGPMGQNQAQHYVWSSCPCGMSGGTSDNVKFGRVNQMVATGRQSRCLQQQVVVVIIIIIAIIIIIIIIQLLTL